MPERPVQVQGSDCQFGPWTLYVKRDGRLSDIFCPQFGDQKVEVVPRSEAEAAELLALRLYDLMRDDDAEHMTGDDVEFIVRLRNAHPREETP